MVLEIATDGAYSSLRNVGGIGIIFYFDGIKKYEYGKTIKNTTNNKCELLAVIIALNAISKPIDSIIVYSDSQYVINTITKGWQRKKNKKYWELFDKTLDKVKSHCPNISFVWIKGHCNNKNPPYSYNDEVDKLAVTYSQLI